MWEFPKTWVRPPKNDIVLVIGAPKRGPNLMWGFSKIRGPMLGVAIRPCETAHSVCGSILGPPIFGNTKSV